jgi:hypothetical protein
VHEREREGDRNERENEAFHDRLRKESSPRAARCAARPIQSPVPRCRCACW